VSEERRTTTSRLRAVANTDVQAAVAAALRSLAAQPGSAYAGLTPDDLDRLAQLCAGVAHRNYANAIAAAIEETRSATPKFCGACGQPLARKP
jgi:hypothetical protein